MPVALPLVGPDAACLALLARVWRPFQLVKTTMAGTIQLTRRPELSAKALYLQGARRARQRRAPGAC